MNQSSRFAVGGVTVGLVSADLLAAGATLLHDAQLHELKSWVMLDSAVSAHA